MSIRERLRQQPYLLAGSALIILALAFLSRNLVRDYMVRPLLLALWHAWTMREGFPQVLVWAMFVAVIPVIAVFNLIVAGRRHETDEIVEHAPPQGQVQRIARWIQQAPLGDYYKTRLFRYLSTVTLNTLGYREDMPEKEVRTRLRSGEMELDAEVLDGIQQGWRKRVEAESSASSKKQGKNRDWHDPQLEKIVEFLEAELEITDEG